MLLCSKEIMFSNLNNLPFVWLKTHLKWIFSLYPLHYPLSPQTLLLIALTVNSVGTCFAFFFLYGQPRSRSFYLCPPLHPYDLWPQCFHTLWLVNVHFYVAIHLLEQWAHWNKQIECTNWFDGFDASINISLNMTTEDFNAKSLGYFMAPGLSRDIQCHISPCSNLFAKYQIKHHHK